MTTPRDTPASRRVRANGDGTVYQRKDSRWEAAGYVLAPDNTRKRIHVYGTTRKDALAKLTEKIAASNRGVPVPSAQGSLAAYLTLQHPAPPGHAPPHPLVESARGAVPGLLLVRFPGPLAEPAVPISR